MWVNINVVWLFVSIVLLNTGVMLFASVLLLTRELFTDVLLTSVLFTTVLF